MKILPPKDRGLRGFLRFLFGERLIVEATGDELDRLFKSGRWRRLKKTP